VNPHLPKPGPYDPDPYQNWLKKRVKHALYAIAVIAIMAMALFALIHLINMPSANGLF